MFVKRGEEKMVEESCSLFALTTALLLAAAVAAIPNAVSLTLRDLLLLLLLPLPLLCLRAKSGESPPELVWERGETFQAPISTSLPSAWASKVIARG